MLMQDATNRTIPVPVTRSYSEGLDVGDYWLAQHGARKGTLQRAQGTSEPGAMSKEILNSTMQYLVTKEDCGTHDGVLMDLTHEDIHDRYTAKPYKLKDGKTVEPGTLITPEVWSRLKNSKHDKVVAESVIFDAGQESNNDPFHILAYGSEKDCREYVTALGKRLGASA